MARRKNLGCAYVLGILLVLSACGGLIGQLSKETQTLVPVGGIAVLVVLVVAGVVGTLSQNAWRQQKEEDLSVTCRFCSRGRRRALARPIAGSGNRYRCPDCGHQFWGARHGL